MKRIINYSLKAFGLHFGGAAAALFLVPVYGAMWPESAVFQWAMTVCIIAILGILLFLPSADLAVKDYMHDELLDKHEDTESPRWFFPWKGLVGGLLSQLPALILLVICLIMPDGFARTMLQRLVEGWYYMFKKLMDIWPQAWYLVCLGGALFSVAVCSIGYLRGREMRLRTKIIMARNDAKRARKKPNSRG